MFAKLAFKNIKRSIKDYAIYFFTLVLGVAIFYVFNSLESQSVMLDVTERVRSMLELMNVVLGVVSVFISFILGALIIYASRFLIKRRSKEFGIYLTLGMSKRKISLILLIETFLIGLFSLAVGLMLGIIISQFTSVLVANMFDANLTNFHFVFSFSAFVKTLIYFGIIYIIVMIFNTFIISKQKLINLLSSSRRSEKVKLKNLWLCTGVFLVAAVMLGYAYYLVTAGLEKLIMDSDGPSILLFPIAMGVTATFLLFWSLSGLLLRIVMSFKKVYYNKLNSFILRQFSSKINTTVISMGLICLMLFVTICVLGSALAINQSLHEAVSIAFPVDAQIESVGDASMNIREVYSREGIDLDDILTDIQTYYTYTAKSSTLKKDSDELTTSPEDSMMNAMVTASGSATVVKDETSRTFIHQSDYNRMAKLFQLPEVSLVKDEYAILANYRMIYELYNTMLKQGDRIKVMGQILSPKYDECIFGTIELEMGGTNDGIYVVPDDITFAGDDIYWREFILGNFVNPDADQENEQKLYSINRRFYSDEEVDEEDRGIYFFNVNLKQEIIDNNVGTSALVTFVGLYLGIIFLISSAAVLALKELSESSDNRDKYGILRKIGASESMLNKALFWQIFIFFLFPLLIAVLHSIFGLMFCDYILSSIGGIDITSSLPWVSGILLAIYGGYFLITYFCSRNMIRERRA